MTSTNSLIAISIINSSRIRPRTYVPAIQLNKSVKDVRAHCYCASLVRTLFIGHACHVIFERAHRVENLTKYRADDLCVNLVCEYFCWKLGDPHFFFGRSLPFLTLSIILKKQKKSVCGKL